MAAEIVKSFHNSEFLRALNLKVKALSSDAAGTVLSNLQESPTSHLIIRGWVVPSSLSDSTVRKEKKNQFEFSHAAVVDTVVGYQSQACSSKMYGT